MNKIAIVMYHYVKNPATNKFGKLNSLSLSQFKEQLDYLSNNFNFISFETLTAAEKGQLTIPKNSVLLTFDDGYIDHYDNVFPLLKQKNIPAFFSMPGKIIAEKKMLDVNKIHILLATADVNKIIPFLYKRLDHYRGAEFSYPGNKDLYTKLAHQTRYDNADVIFIKRLLQAELPEKLRNIITDELLLENGCDQDELVKTFYLNWQQVKEMHNAGMEWGIHGYDHYWMNKLSEPELTKDINQALDVFADVLPSKGWGCCYPYGSIDENVEKIVGKMGAVIGLTTEVNYATLPTKRPLALPRFDTNDFPPKSMEYKMMFV